MPQKIPFIGRHPQGGESKNRPPPKLTACRNVRGAKSVGRQITNPKEIRPPYESCHFKRKGNFVLFPGDLPCGPEKKNDKT